jgi:hypothetical protein
LVPPTAILVTTALLLLSCGGSAEDRKRLEALEKSVTDELAALRQEIAAAKLAPNDKVDIELQGVGPNTKIAIVDPSKKPSCKNQQANCGKEVRWTLRGALPEGWYVKIEEKSDSPNKDCFAEPTFTASERHRASGEPAESCRGEGASWSYSVTLYDQANAPKSIVDPLIVMNWSP